jgi:hypothetical protein
MKALVVLGAIATTLVAASIATDTRAPQAEVERIEEYQAETPLEVVRESDGIFYEYPSMEDAGVINSTSEDSIVHFIMFQEKVDGDVYSIK